MLYPYIQKKWSDIGVPSLQLTSAVVATEGNDTFCYVVGASSSGTKAAKFTLPA
jgi:hypothetical protein